MRRRIHRKHPLLLHAFDAKHQPPVYLFNFYHFNQCVSASSEYVMLINEFKLKRKQKQTQIERRSRKNLTQFN